jgi:hypothetical protein
MDESQRQFPSVTAAVMRYIRLYQLLGTCRSIPLKKGATQVSRGDSHNRWEVIRSEFAYLTHCFPSTGTIEWHLLMVSVMSNIQDRQRRQAIERLTGKRWSPHQYENAVARAYGQVTAALRARDLLEPQHSLLLEL